MNANHKSDFRKLCIEKLKLLSPFSKYYKNKIVVKNLREFILKHNINNILLYIPMDIEVDVMPLIKDLRKYKKSVYVPYIKNDSFKIVKYRLPLYKKRFGIKEPNNSFLKAEKLDLAIVPVIGIDKINKRIGFGKGMYDRFFSTLGYKPTIIFTQLQLCKSMDILSDNYDIKADYIITG